jgi:hypothetical protein
MVGFTGEELKEILNNQEISQKEQEKIIPIMKENYGNRNKNCKN